MWKVWSSLQSITRVKYFFVFWLYCGLTNHKFIISRASEHRYADSSKFLRFEQYIPLIKSLFKSADWDSAGINLCNDFSGTKLMRVIWLNRNRSISFIYRKYVCNAISSGLFNISLSITARPGCWWQIAAQHVTGIGFDLLHFHFNKSML